MKFTGVSGQRCLIDSHAYLKDVLTRLPAMTNRDDLAPLLPANWQKPGTAFVSLVLTPRTSPVPPARGTRDYAYRERGATAHFRELRARYRASAAPELVAMGRG